MNSTQETIQEIKAIIRRRKILLIITPVLFVALSYGALQVIEPEYESSISILIEEDESLNTFLLSEMGEEREEQDKIMLFENFINSRSTIEMLIDSLDLDTTVTTGKGKQALVNDVESRISVDSEASDLISISYTSPDPVLARNAAEILGNYFISTRTYLLEQQNRETVKFLQAKLDDLKNVMDQQKEEIVSSTSEQMRVNPVNTEALRSELQSTGTRAQELDLQMYEAENRISIIQDFLDQSENEFSVQPLYRLSLENISSGSDLADLLSEYEELNQQYTDDYPRIVRLKSQITEAAKRILPTMQSNLERLRMQREELNSERSELMTDMQQSFVAEQQNETKQSSFSIYQNLYDEMKVRLEQARMASEVKNMASDKYQVVDVPFVADNPSSPNRTIVLAVGLLLGFIIGGLLISVAELLDNTIRSEDDLKELKKPVIAYLSDGRI